MSPVGSPTLRAHKLLQQNVSTIRQRLESVRTEAVTGRVSDVARAVNGDTAKVHRLSQSIAYAEDRTTILAFEGERASTIQTTISSIRGQLSSAADAVAMGLTGSAPQSLDTAEVLAASGFSDAVGRLNGDFGGRPMFGGDSGTAPLISADAIMTALRDIVAAAPDTATALSDIDAYFNDPAGGFATTAYQGGDGDAPKVELSQSERVSSTVRADEDALRQTLHGFAVTALAAETATETDRMAMMERGSALLRGAIDGTIELQTGLGVREERIAVAQTNYQAQATSLSLAMNALTGRDQAEAATEMRLLESQLEAAYLTTSRLASLTLTNYLR